MLFLTFNLWMDDYDLGKRMTNLHKLIKTLSPDFIGFQEVTKNIYTSILPYLKDYYISGYDGTTSFGCLLCSKHEPIDGTILSFTNSRQEKYAVGCKCKFIRDNVKEEISVYTMQLETDNELLANIQLGLLCENIKDNEKVAIMGDMSIKKRIEIPREYKEYSAENTYTNQNPLMKGSVSSRPDRIFTKGLKGKDMKVVKEYISSHYGLILVI